VAAISAAAHHDTFLFLHKCFAFAFDRFLDAMADHIHLLRVMPPTTHSSIPPLPVSMAASAPAIAATDTAAWLRVLEAATSSSMRSVTVMEEA